MFQTICQTGHDPLVQADFLASQGGKVGITLNVNWGEPEDETNPEHLEASQRFMDFFLGWYANPIFVDGKYPEVYKNQCYAKDCLRKISRS